jgi:uncharacterized MAPEG superfamily protein
MTAVAKSNTSYDNADPRGWLARQSGFRQRASAAQHNSFEAFPFFAAAVLTAHLLHAPQARVDLLAGAFIAARVLYLAMYLANLPALRSLVWFLGLGCVIALFAISA